MRAAMKCSKRTKQEVLLRKATNCIWWIAMRQTRDHYAKEKQGMKITNSSGKSWANESSNKQGHSVCSSVSTLFAHDFVVSAFRANENCMEWIRAQTWINIHTYGGRTYILPANNKCSNVLDIMCKFSLQICCFTFLLKKWKAETLDRTYRVSY